VGVDMFLQKFERQIYNCDGRFEGISYDYETFSDNFLSNVVNGRISISEVLKSNENLKLEEREEITQSACLIHHWILEGSLWWNPKKYSLPNNYIERKVKFHSPEDSNSLVSVTEAIQNSGKIAWLVEPPGMGKSTVITKLEEEYRESIKTNRIILRINLNTIQSQLETLLSSNEQNSSFLYFIKNFAPFIPNNLVENVSEETLKVILLLDGLDEISLENSEKMIKILTALLRFTEILDESRDESFVSTIIGESIREPFHCENIFLTTRPHLRTLIEDNFGLTLFSLLPLEQEEQISYLSKEISSEFSFTAQNAKESLSALTPDSECLMGNPLFLSLFAQVVKDNYRRNQKTQDLNIFELYDRFVNSKHWLHVVMKEGKSPNKESTQIRVRNLLEENIAFYFEIAVNQLKLDTSLLEKYLVSSDEIKSNELVNYGLIHLFDGKKEFIHRSFAEFFCAKYLISLRSQCVLLDTLFPVLLLEELPNLEMFISYALQKR